MAQGRFYRELPKQIIDILAISQGWLVGSSISNILEGKTPKDYDIIIKDVNHIATYSYIRQFPIEFNSFGGFRVKIDDLSIDVWIEELDHFLLVANGFTYAYNFRKNLMIKNE